MSVFIDTAVFMYAGGQDHPLREPCQAILRKVTAGTLEAVTSVEVVQEILHRFIAIRRPRTGAAMAIDVLSTFAPLLPVTHAVVERLPDLVERYPHLTARDLIHVATCLEEDIDSVVSPDRGFDDVSEITRIDPAGR
jgi:predicted nucleic acid-binding protein